MRCDRFGCHDSAAPVRPVARRDTRFDVCTELRDRPAARVRGADRRVSGLFARDGFLVDQRTPCDCMRGAVATYLGLPYELTPEISGTHDATTFWADWAQWLASCGLVMATFACAPAHLDRWVAIVGRERAGPLHAVVMSRSALFHDPAPLEERLRVVDRDDVFCAMVIGPLDESGWPQTISETMSAALASGSADTWCLRRLMDAPWNVDLLRLRGQQQAADAMRRRLGQVRGVWPAASIAPQSGVEPAL
jgi:hypothetical protein